MRLSIEKLKKLRSGNCVWRTLFHVNTEGGITGTVTACHVLGKKTLHWFDAWSDEYPRRSSIRMNLKGKTDFHHRNREYSVHFLEDLRGSGCFTSKKQADKFVREVLEGLHPDVSNHTYWLNELDKDLFSCYYPLDYD